MSPKGRFRVRQRHDTQLRVTTEKGALTWLVALGGLGGIAAAAQILWPGNPRCTPGKLESCVCDGESQGQYACLPDGTGYGPCTCPGRPKPKPSAELEPLTRPAELLDKGFYKVRGEAPIYWIYEQEKYCQVQNPLQLNVLGGTQWSDATKLELERSVNTGACRWPPGIYKLQKESSIYRIFAGEGSVDWRICHIKEGELDRFGGLGSVRIVGDESNLNVGVVSAGDCE